MSDLWISNKIFGLAEEYTKFGHPGIQYVCEHACTNTCGTHALKA